MNPSPDSLMTTYHGIGAAPGLAEAPLVHYRRQALNFPRQQGRQADVELRRLQDSRQVALQELLELSQKVAREASKDEAAVFEAHAMIVEDGELTDKVAELLRDGWNAEVAWMEAVEFFAEQLASLEDPTLRARAADVRDVGRRVLRLLTGSQAPDVPQLQTLAVIVADDLAPSETAAMDKSKVAAFCTAQGGPTSHSAILAKALGIPAVVGLGSGALAEGDGAPTLVDGSTGTVVTNPDAATLEIFHDQQRAAQSKAGQELAHAQEPAVTPDGHRVEIAANIGGAADAQKALENGAEGVGLFRTEFLYLKRNVPPDEETQYRAYRQALEVMGSRPVIIRTLDAGGDKDIPYLDRGQEANPFLGWRAIRVCLDMPEMFNTQLRALLRAGAGHALRVMFPMIATLEETRQARALLAAAWAQLQAEGVPAAGEVKVGIMVEIPAAVVMADQLAREVDFFSIGTNDLTQYTMAAERTNQRVAHLGDACHPAVLRQIQRVIEVSHQAGIWTGVCGELAGDPDAAPLLLGLGLDEFSMSSFSIPHIKAVIRAWPWRDAQALAKVALDKQTAAEVRQLVREATAKRAGR
jgi:phosphoenolpyruvate-protein phosphotransferase